MFSNKPEVVGIYHLECPEMMFVQYIPICIDGRWAVPANLHWTEPLVIDAADNEECSYKSNFKYVYLTVKHMYQAAGESYNRHGMHIDGFGTDDINYVWSDSTPTEFYVQEFDLPEDHSESMDAMYKQAISTCQVLFPNNTLLRLDNTMVHRVSPYGKSGMRTFVKISFSNHKYNLKGNAHNYLLDYDWEMVDRNVERNCPQGLK